MTDDEYMKGVIKYKLAGITGMEFSKNNIRILRQYTGDKQSFKVLDGTESLGRLCFNSSKVEYLYLPDSINYLDDSTFYLNKTLKSIRLPMKMNSIGYRCFSYCCNLESIEMPKSLKVIEDCAFINCSNLKSIDLPSDLEIIGSHAFSSCRSLEAIVIPKGVRMLRTSAFDDCNPQLKIYLPENFRNDSYLVNNLRKHKLNYYRED